MLILSLCQMEKWLSPLVNRFEYSAMEEARIYSTMFTYFVE